MVIEVGLGGTWDSTNVMHGDVAVLTNFSYDHTDVLGPTLEGIAEDKSGIIEEGSVVVVGETRPDLVAIVEAHAARVGAAAVWVAGRDFGCEDNRVAVGGRLVTLWTPGGRYQDVLVPLHGAHQGTNAAGALAAAEAFFGRPLDPAVVDEGFGLVRVPGRLEVLGRRPLVVVDGAHNVAGMTALGLALAEEFAVEGNTVAVVGMLSGRDPSAMLAALAPAGVSTVVACQPDSPRPSRPRTWPTPAGRWADRPCGAFGARRAGAGPGPGQRPWADRHGRFAVHRRRRPRRNRPGPCAGRSRPMRPGARDRGGCRGKT